ncbi:MAG: DUF2029 domain-containing protein [Brevefilum sp.]|nr:DUF2029 domain-containing protein [Brevefilum sp.]
MMKRYRRTAASQYLVVIIIFLSIIGVGLLSAFVMSHVPFTDDFVLPWAAGRSWLLDGESPYAPLIIQQSASVIDETPFLASLPDTPVFREPLLSLVFYLPFSLMSYATARVIWMTILAICVGMIGFFSIQLSGWKGSPFEQFGAILLMVFWLPGASAILTGQLAPIIIVLILAGVYLVINGQDTTAGLLLSLTFSVFPTSGLILIVLLIWGISMRRWSLVSGYFSGVIFLLVISWLVMPSWFTEWAAVMLDTYQGWGWVSTPLMNLAGLLPGIASPLSIFLHGAMIVYSIMLTITILGQSGRAFLYKTFVVFILAYLLHVQPRIFLLLLLIPALFMVFRSWAERWGLVGNLLSWFVLILIGGGSWFLVETAFDFTQPTYKPWLTFGYPLLVLMGMVWIRWWALRIPRLPYDTY